MEIQPCLLYDIMLYLLLGYIHYGSVKEALCLYSFTANRKFSETERCQSHRVVMIVYYT